jgi:hypothetical protein
MKPSPSIVTAALLLPLIAFAGDDGEVRAAQREVGRTTEKEVKVSLYTAVGTVFLGRGESQKIITVDGDAKDLDEKSAILDYDIRNRVGYLNISLGNTDHEPGKKNKSFSLTELEGGSWVVKLTDALPLSLDLELGFGEGRFDFSGLQIKDLNLSAGASDVSVAFDEPNQSSIENISIESGLSKFTARNLCNANFKHLHFQGGVGAYSLDFGGNLDSEVDVDIEVGMGLVSLYVPQGIGVKVIHQDNWMSNVNCDSDFTTAGENELISGNYYSSTGKMNIHVDSGLGSIKIRRK